jgi:hypothetical protein
MWLDNVECNGKEKEIIDCLKNEWAENDCNHMEIAGVECNTDRLDTKIKQTTKSPELITNKKFTEVNKLTENYLNNSLKLTFESQNRLEVCCSF